MTPQWELDLAESKRQRQEENDAFQDETYEYFLEEAGLEHSERIWNAFVIAWTAGVGTGMDWEYSYPS